MSYDCLIIGGGLSGLTCGIKCAGEGLRTVIISGGMSCLHFSSGSIDLFGYEPGRKIVYNPFKYIQSIKTSMPYHPYSKIGIKTIRESLEFFREETGREDFRLYNNGQDNHFHITAMGILKPTYFSQDSVFNEKLKLAIENKTKIAILNFEGFRDQFPELAVEQLKTSSIMKNVEITTGTIKLPDYTDTGKNIMEFRSIDLARIFETERFLPRIATEIKKAAGDAGIVSLPAFIGINNFNEIHAKLQELTGLLIYEVPTLPPSILGMRLDNALKKRFASLGGEFSAGDRVIKGDISNGKVDCVYTENYGETGHHSRYYVLAAGSFFSGGLESGFNRMSEPVFDLKFNGRKNRAPWYSDDFLNTKSHPFLSFGVDTDSRLNPFDNKGTCVSNLFCAGAVLSGYDPIREGSGGGVAIATGYFAAQKIIGEIRK